MEECANRVKIIREREKGIRKGERHGKACLIRAAFSAFSPIDSAAAY